MNKLLNDPHTDERTVTIDVAAVVNELNQASDSLRRVAAHLVRAGNGHATGNGRAGNGYAPGSGYAPGNGRTAPTSVGDRLTTKQLGAIHAIARRAGLSKDGLAQELHRLTGNADPAVLSRREASDVIDHLGRLADSTP